jgi:hypothetical protein
MKLGEFVGHLDGNEGLDLEFTVSGRRISGSYHITEIKSARIESVDCGGTQNRWAEVVFQLLEPGQDDPSRRMTVGRARKIYDDASRIQVFDRDAEVIFEYEPEGAPTVLLRVGWSRREPLPRTDRSRRTHHRHGRVVHPIAHGVLRRQRTAPAAVAFAAALGVLAPAKPRWPSAYGLGNETSSARSAHPCASSALAVTSDEITRRPNAEAQRPGRAARPVPPTESTKNLLVITGPPGSGKTPVLHELVALRPARERQRQHSQREPAEERAAVHHWMT